MTTGHRRGRPAPRHRARRRHGRVLALALALPALLGMAALALASSGAAAPTAAHATTATLASGADTQPSAGLGTGTDATGYTDTLAESRRQVEVSRDSERQALQDSAGSKAGQASEAQAQETNAELKSLGRAAEAKAGQIPKNAWHLPTQGYHLTARFGQAGGHWVSNHTGLDFAAPTGTPIFAVAAGTITETGWAGAYGNRTVETLPDGTELWYAHQSAIRVKVGQQVLSGQTIGAVGSTGNTTGPHVHLEVRPGGGDPVDPYQALVVHGVKP